jgi:hypothetical protein
MKPSRKRVLKSCLAIVAVGFVLTFASVFRVSESACSRDGIELTCVMSVSHIPLKVAARGFPLFWLLYVEGVDQIGGGPVAGAFAIYSVNWPALFIDVAFYSLLSLGVTLFHQLSTYAQKIHQN